MKFIVEPSVFETLKGVCFAVVTASNIDNTQRVPEIEMMLQNNITSCETYFENKSVKQSEEIICYRNAFHAMNINPNKYMCSIESLLTRISKKKGMPFINPIVDLGNAVSLKYKVPIGAHDINSSDEDFYVRKARPDDYFIPFGETERERPDSDEIIYAAGQSVRTRRWIWRQSEQGKITENTTDVFFPIDGFDYANKEQILLASKELSELLKYFFNCDVYTGLVDYNNNEFTVKIN